MGTQITAKIVDHLTPARVDEPDDGVTDGGLLEDFVNLGEVAEKKKKKKKMKNDNNGEKRKKKRIGTDGEKEKKPISEIAPRLVDSDEFEDESVRDGGRLEDSVDLGKVED